MFDGVTGRRRAVSLRGRSRASERTREEILEASRDARARRERDRATTRAVETCQARRRSTVAVRRARETARASYDGATWDDDGGVETATRRARWLGFFGDERRDVGRVAACATACVADANGRLRETFVASVGRGGDAVGGIDDGAGREARLRGLTRTAKLARVTLRALRAASSEETDGRHARALAMGLMAMMRRDDERWGRAGIELCGLALCDGRELEVIRDALRMSTLSVETREALRMTCENIARCENGGALAWALATIPRVWDALGGVRECRELWAFVVSRLAAETAPTTGDGLLRDVGVALGNVLRPVKTFVSDAQSPMDVRAARALVETVTALVASPSSSGAMFTMEGEKIDVDADEGEDEDDDDDDEYDARTKKADALNLRSVRAERRKARAIPADADVDAVRRTSTFADVHDFFGDASSIARLMGALLPAGDERECTNSSEAFSSFVFACDFTLRGIERQTFLRALTFGTDCFGALWPALVHDKEARSRAHRRLLGVFAKFYNMYTMISDDEEFYRLGKPLNLEATKTFIAMLRDALWQLLWIERGPDGTPLDAITFSDECIDAETWYECSAALALLHDRNGRHQFVNPLVFQVSETHVDIPALLQEARDPKSRASTLLSGAPCLVSFEVRVHKFMDERRRSRQIVGAGYAGISVRRGHLLEDGVNALSNKLTETLSGIIRVQFINEQGLEEAGVDGGGLFKDFLNDLIAEAFNPKFGLFIETPERTLYPNPASEMHAGERHLQYFFFLGAILGKACYEGILLDVPLAGFLLAALKGRRVEFNDLVTLDPELYRNLVSLKRYPGNVEDLCLYFTAMDRSGMEETEIELIPNGSNVLVTNANAPRYLNCMSIFLLRAQMYRQLASMKAGFEIMMRKRWLNMFTPAELRLLISGNRTGSMDIADMAANCEYSGGYDASHPTIRVLWNVMRELTPDEQREVLKFITACSNTPLLGFSHLEPKLTIHRSGTSGTDAPDATADLTRLPTAATCMNLLKLPPYSSKAMLKEKLLYAVQSGSGFDLS